MDLFEDLVEKPKVREEPVAKVPRSEKPAGTFVDADAFNPTAATREDVERAVPLIEEKRADHTTISMTKDELSLLISQAIEASMSKFVKSLRTVLEDMGRRIESTTKGGQEVKIRLDSLEEVMNGHAQQSNSRFTSLDLAMKEIDRGVQSMRDKQELIEAQAILARLSAAEAPLEKKAASNEPLPPPPKEAPTPTPTLTPAPISVPLQAPVAAPAPASAQPPSPSPVAPPYAPPQYIPDLNHPPQYFSGPPPVPQAPPPAPHLHSQYSASAPFQVPAAPPPEQAGYSIPPPSQAMYSAPAQYPPPPQQPRTPSSNFTPYPTPPSLPSYPPPVNQSGYRPQQQQPPSGGGAPPRDSRPLSRNVPLDQVITDITNMGFERWKVDKLIANLQKNGQAIDLNVILDKLTRGELS